MPLSLGTFIRERRQDLGLSQEQLAERVGEKLRQSEISRLERGQVFLPRRERLEQLAAALDVSLGELLVRSGWMEEGDRLATEINAATRAFRTPKDREAIALQDLASMIETVAALQDTVTEVAQMLAQATATIDSLMRALNVESNTRDIVRAPANLIDEWETAEVYVI